MKKFTLLFLLSFIFLPLAVLAQADINLTPLPMKMSIGTGSLTLPESFSICTNSLPEEFSAEAGKFAIHLGNVTGYNVEIKDETGDALFTLNQYSGSEELGDEGYTLDITTSGVDIAANTATGFFYAFQSIKKMLPANVMAGVKDNSVTEYSLPCVNIVDAPRFEYRGFMLDVARHYFEVEEIKRMIDVMSYYKMNRFHWHLTDDQGWRFEVKKYPRLTTVGATRSDSWSVDPEYGGYYTGEPYGPYFYTQDECREIVEYAAERHIEVIPEVEFPGHSCAVNAAYPELSCNPNGAHSVQVNGGIYNDVLNVANPLVLQFAKDVLDEIIDVFPYKYIHIGGDETPTTAWQNNAECQAMMQKMGFSNIRELQSYFVRHIADYLSQKEGAEKRTVIMWNESLTAGGTNIELIEGTQGTLMCWENGQVQPGALKAAKLGMSSIITPWGPYYINRKQSRDPGEPTGAGYGDDTVEATYNYVPVPASVPTELQKYYIGVQGTFWTEHVQSNYLLEYLALPRLIAIAETGWTPAEKKDFTSFQQRITQDTLLLNYNKYEYGRHYILGNESNNDKVMPTPSTDENKVWYRIVTTATDARAGRCIQLLREGMNIADKTGTAPAGRLWNSEIIEDESNEGYDYQLWAFMQDPDNPERWAIVNKAKPNGSVKGTPTAENNTGRWDYDDNNHHYDFIFGDKAYSQNGNNYTYSIRSQKVSNTNMCLNYAGPGQNYSINLWSDPADGNGGIWEFRPAKEQECISVNYPTSGTTYRIVNNTERFKRWSLYDNGDATVTATQQQYGADVWELTDAATTDAGQTFKLRNVATGRYISSGTAPIAMGENGITLTNTYNTRSSDFSIMAGDGALYPIPERATANPNTLNKGGIYPQGTGWIYEKAGLATYECHDEQGNLLQKLYQSIPEGNEFTAEIPAITNYEAVSHTIESDGGNKRVKVTYNRVAYSIKYRCYTLGGNFIAEIDVPCTIGESHSVDYPEVEFFTCIGSDTEEGTTLIPAEDTEIDVFYDCEGIMGAAAVGEAVTEIEGGASYLLYNAKDETSRSGFLSVSKVGDGITTTNGIMEANPSFVWNFEGDGNRFTVMNNYGIYIPKLLRGSLVTGSETPETFIFSFDESSTTWSVQGTSNSYYWNGNANNTFTGWDGGHPFIVYSYIPHPYFTVTYSCVDEEGNELSSTTRYVKGGDAFTILTPIFEGYTLKACDANYDELAYVSRNLSFTLTYSNGETGITEISGESCCDNVIYDLCGRRVTGPTKGIYIVNGKKIYIE